MTHALRGPGGRDVLVLGQNWSFCGPGVSVSHLTGEAEL